MTGAIGPEELLDAPVQHDASCTSGLVVEGKASDEIHLCPMCQTPLPGLGKTYGRVYHGLQSVQQMNGTLGTPVQEPFDFKDCSHSAKCDVARKVVRAWCRWYGPCACVSKALDRGWSEYEAGTVCDRSMNYWQGCTCL